MKPLLDRLAQVEKIAAANKVNRLLQHPFRYLDAVLFRKVWYPFSKKGKLRLTNTFFDAKMHILLPAGTDIYLTGGKSHDSELRLARFLIKNLNEGDAFLDIGAHFGYFTLLAAQLVGKNGQVWAYEASKSTFAVLERNTAPFSQVKPHCLALSDAPGTVTFYEFPVLYSEFNSMELDQFGDTSWYRKYPPVKNEIPAVTLDAIIQTQVFVPKIIKIDVEGAEDKVIQGAHKALKEHAPMVVLEYLAEARHNSAHRQAAEQLQALGFAAGIIDQDGLWQRCEQVETHLQEQQLDSDNVVFIKD
jgi:FkbM family methyltransferase